MIESVDKLLVNETNKKICILLKFKMFGYLLPEYSNAIRID